jgi:uncharacterized membrane protein
MRHALAIGGGVLATLIVFPWLPRHLDADGHPLIMKIAVVSFLPIAASVIHLLLRSVLARTGHHREDQAAKTILWCVTLFVMTLHALLMGALLDIGRASASRLVLVAAGIALVVIGNVLPRLGPNLALGIRTRRTLSDRQLWRVTHRVAGYAVVAVGFAVAISGLLLRGPAMPAVVCVTALGGSVAVALTHRRATHA